MKAENTKEKWSRILASKRYGKESATLTPADQQELLDDILSIGEQLNTPVKTDEELEESVFEIVSDENDSSYNKTSRLLSLFSNTGRSFSGYEVVKNPEGKVMEFLDDGGIWLEERNIWLSPVAGRLIEDK